MNDTERGAFDVAVSLLSHKMRSRRTLVERLLQKGFSEKQAQGAVDKLTELRILDDAAYAERMAAHCRAKGYGAGRFRRMLIEKKVDREAMDAVLAEYEPDDDKVRSLVAAAFSGQPPDRATVKKVSDKLFRLGHAWDDISRYIGAYRDSAETENDAV